MLPPSPLRQPVKPPTNTLLATLTSAASSIPGLIHDGLTTLSGYGQAFEDEAAFPRPSDTPSHIQDSNAHESQLHQVSASYASSTYAQPPPGLTDSEALEFFRKRPHLLKNHRGSKNSFLSPEYSSGITGI